MKVIKQSNLLESLPILPTAILFLILDTQEYPGWYWFLAIMATVYIWYYTIKREKIVSP